MPQMMDRSAVEYGDTTAKQGLSGCPATQRKFPKKHPRKAENMTVEDCQDFI